MSTSRKAYLAEKYMSGPKADAILARTTAKKKKRKAGTSNSNPAASGSSGLIVDDDDPWVPPPHDEDEEDLEDALVVKDRSFKRRKVGDPPSGGHSGTTKPSGGGWTTIQEGVAGAQQEEGSPPPTADELPQIAGVVEDAPSVVSGLLTKAQLRKKLGPKPTERGRRLEDEEDNARQQETVYRDASGRKIDMKAEKAEAARRKREAEEKEAKKMEWGKGHVQREEKERERALMEKERERGFARHADDAELNEEQKAKEMWNDPAAAFLTKKRNKGPRKPEYTGPTPPPNRFGIKPGYRWDGVDRSNGFEQKYFQRQNERKRQGAESYSWSVDDM